MERKGGEYIQRPLFISFSSGREERNALLEEEYKIASQRPNTRKSVLEPGGAFYDPFPRGDEITDAHKKMADLARRRMGWTSDVFPG